MMGEISNISWTDATWNPFYGCHKISPGCAYCYMDRWAKRSGRDPEKVTRAKEATFYAPLKWKESKRIFTCSLSDYFIEEADSWRSEADAVMRATPQHTYLILTKRIDRAIKLEYKPAANVWFGISAENQTMLNRRLPLLFQIAAEGYFISAEPLLEGLNFWKAYSNWHLYRNRLMVIVGGESGGPEYRQLVFPIGQPTGRWRVNSDREIYKWGWEPKHEALRWIRSIRDQCLNAGVKFHFKQFGGPKPESGGRLLDGREWQEFPHA